MAMEMQQGQGQRGQCNEDKDSEDSVMTMTHCIRYVVPPPAPNTDDHHIPSVDDDDDITHP